MEKYKIRYSDLFWVFTITSVIGFFLEGMWHTMRKGYWEDHTATIWGPFCLIYGFAAVVLYLVAYMMKTKNVVVLFLVSAFAGSGVELVTAEMQELCFGTYSWNYSGHAVNFAGKLSLQMSVIWGILGLVFMKYMFPHITKMLSHMREGKWHVLCIMLSIFMVINMAATCAVVYRWTRRVRGEAASNAVERFVDKKWNNETMESVFPNMKFVEER